MDSAIKKSEEAEEAAEANEPAQSRQDPAHGRNGQRDENQGQGGVSGIEFNLARGVGAEIVNHGAPGEPRDWSKAAQPDQRFKHDECASVHRRQSGIYRFSEAGGGINLT